MLNGGISFPKFVKVVERAKVTGYRFEGTATPCCCTLPTRECFNTDSGSVDEACKKKRTCLVLDWIAYLYTLEHCGV